MKIYRHGGLILIASLLALQVTAKDLPDTLNGKEVGEYKVDAEFDIINLTEAKKGNDPKQIFHIVPASLDNTEDNHRAPASSEE
jgi:hypothetical protein